MAKPWKPNTYPPTRRSDHVNIYKSEKRGEVKVHDPYEWLGHDTEETQAWITAQETLTRKYLDQNDDRQHLEDGIRKNIDYAKVGIYHNLRLCITVKSDRTTCSSLHPAWKEMVAGIGSTTAVFRPSQVLKFPSVTNDMLFRSTDSLFISDLSLRGQHSSRCDG